MSDLQRYYGYYEKEWEQALTRSFLLEDGAAGTTVVEEGIVLPLKRIPGTVEMYGDGIFAGGVADADGNFAAGQIRSLDELRTNRSCICSYDSLEGLSIRERDETVIFGGILVSHWGHMLVDATSRLWYPVLHPERREKLVFVRFPEQKFPYEELMELAGIPADSYEIIDEPTRFRRIIVPDETIHSISGHYRREWISFFDAVRDHVVPSEHKKIYLTRTAFKFDNVCGEQYFEDFFAARGYKVVSPEKLSIRDQVSLMAGAEEVTATMGTIAHLALFTNSDANMTVVNRSREIVDIQIAIIHARGIRCRYVDAFRNFLPERQGGNCVFLLAPNEPWRRYVREVFDLESDPQADEEIFHRTAVEYARKWGEFFSDARHFKWIRDCECREVVEAVNLAFREVRLDTSGYLPSGREEQLEKQLQESRAEALKACFADRISESGEDLILQGQLSIPFCDAEKLRFGAFLLPGDQVRTGIPVETVYDREADVIRWSISADRRTLQEQASLRQAGERRMRLFLSVSDEHTQRDLVILYRPKVGDILAEGPVNAVTIGREFFVPAVNERSELVLDWMSEEALFRKPAQITVSDVSWNGGTLVLRGRLETIVAGAPDLKIFGFLRPFRREEERENYLPADVRILSRSYRMAEWEMRIDASAMMNSPLSDESQRWDPCLVMALTGEERPIRFGSGGDAECSHRFSEPGTIRGGDVILVPGETGKMNFSFYRYTIRRFLRRFWIENLRWDNGDLKMDGSLEWMHPLLQTEGSLVLLNRRQEPVFRVPLAIRADSKTAYRWSVCLPGEELGTALHESAREDAGDGRAEYCLAFAPGYPLSAAPIRIGNKRRPGSLDRFRQIPQFIPGAWVRAMTFGAEEYLGLSVVPEARPEEIVARFWLADIEWSASSLILSGELERLYADVPAEFSLRLQKESGESVFETPLPVTPGDKKGTLCWRTEIGKELLFDTLENAFAAAGEPSKETYGFALAVTCRGAEGAIPVGGKRQPGTWGKYRRIPQHRGRYQISGARIGAEENLGFSVEKKQGLADRILKRRKV